MDNRETDIIVVGGGPAGCYAAWAAAEKGLNCRLLEEHTAIGLARHDPGWLIDTPFTEQLADRIKENLLIRRMTAFRVRDPFTGDILEDVPGGGYIVRRDLLERELAIRAANAGAQILLKTRCTGFLKEKGRVIGVKTDREDLPELRAPVVICADGLHSTRDGLAAGEITAEENLDFGSGVNLELANLKDTEPGTVELYLTATNRDLNYKHLVVHEEGQCFLSFSSLANFVEVKERTDNILSEKLRRAQCLHIGGYLSRRHSGLFLKTIVKDGVIFIGDASGGGGAIHGMIQGCLAAGVAAQAIEKGDSSLNTLSLYQDLVTETFQGALFYWFFVRENYGTFANWIERMRKIRVAKV
ncbi:MAG: NAD(P)/FAD-dependent oxidoreductase [Candidatus Auribacterota bacterium]|nr:NAD(P)/FAD-dependent oxidoreductase [Candidatus Auribacterota bacterium]